MSPDQTGAHSSNGSPDRSYRIDGAGGLMPLVVALDYASDVASALREIHDQGRSHGSVAESVTEAGTLLPPPANREKGQEHRDIRDFGALLYQLATGEKADTAVGAIQPLSPARRRGPQGVRTSVAKLALNCLHASNGAQPNMQQVVTELRLYLLLARQWHSELPPAPSCLPKPESAGLTVAPAPPATAAAEPVEAQPSGVKCPRCRGPYVYASRPRTAFEVLLAGIGTRWRRCHRCFHRFGSLLGLVFSKGNGKS